MTTTTVLPQRPGQRPQAHPATPHQQLTQNAPIAWQEELWRRMSSLDNVLTGRSIISLPDTRALHLDPEVAAGPPEAFSPGSTEFAHLHGPADGSLHVCLPEAIATEADLARTPPSTTGSAMKDSFLSFSDRKESFMAPRTRLVTG